MGIRNSAYEVYGQGNAASVQSLVPRLKFQFTVEINFNSEATAYKSPLVLNRIVEVTMPSHTIKTQTVNQYNKKRHIQTGIEYSPFSMTVYDTRDGDSRESIEVFLKEYHDYYYGSTMNDAVAEVFQDDIISALFKGSKDDVSSKGLKLRPERYFINSIVIKRQSSAEDNNIITIYNPIITSVQGDTLSYSDNAAVQYRIEFEFEGYETKTNDYQLPETRDESKKRWQDAAKTKADGAAAIDRMLREAVAAEEARLAAAQDAYHILSADAEYKQQLAELQAEQEQAEIDSATTAYNLLQSEKSLAAAKEVEKTKLLNKALQLQSIDAGQFPAGQPEVIFNQSTGQAEVVVHDPETYEKTTLSNDIIDEYIENVSSGISPSPELLGIKYENDKLFTEDTSGVREYIKYDIDEHFIDNGIPNELNARLHDDGSVRRSVLSTYNDISAVDEFELTKSHTNHVRDIYRDELVKVYNAQRYIHQQDYERELSVKHQEYTTAINNNDNLTPVKKTQAIAWHATEMDRQLEEASSIIELNAQNATFDKITDDEYLTNLSHKATATYSE